MLHLFNSLARMDTQALMEIYAESNCENAEDMFPDLESSAGILRVESEFLDYLRRDFFSQPGAVYALWRQDGIDVSALRLEPYKSGYLLEALETRPDSRNRGYACDLIRAVQQLPQYDCLYSHVSRRNLPSMTVHQKSGFNIILDHAVYLDGSINTRSCTLQWVKEKTDR